MATRLEIYNLALFELGEALLASLSENREPRRALDAVWQNGVETCLQAGAWNHASRTVRIDADPSLATVFGWSYVFAHPDDWLRTVGVSEDEYLDYPLDRYLDEGGRFMADVDPIYLRYVSNDAAYGFDTSLWPANFTAYVSAYLASLIAPRIRESKQADMVKLSRLRFSKAAATDAVGQPTTQKPVGRFVRARSGGVSGNGERGIRSRLIG
jgi:hypothetical protein